MKNLEKHFRINAKFTVLQWDLYTHHPECDMVCDYLNAVLMDCVNEQRLDKNGTRDKMLAAMELFPNTGARDTEPRAFLAEVLRDIYG